MNKSNNLSRVLEISTANEIKFDYTMSQQYQNLFSKRNTNIKTKDIKASIRKEYSYIFPIRTTFFHVPIDQFFKKPVSPSLLLLENHTSFRRLLVRREQSIFLLFVSRDTSISLQTIFTHFRRKKLRRRRRIGKEAKLEIALSCNWIPNVYARNYISVDSTLLLISIFLSIGKCY